MKTRILHCLSLIFAIIATVSGFRISSKEPNAFPYNYLNVSNLIIQVAQSSSRLDTFEYLCDEFGPRYRGTPNLELAIDWILQTMADQGLENVRGENVFGITNWIRGKEYLKMSQPRSHNMALLGLGNSVGTPKEGITAEVLVVSSFDDLAANASNARGKIVVFNAPFVSYGQTVIYRVLGASKAAQYGAVAALVRSITPFSLYTPHTGAMFYQSGIAQIPTAAITIEDAEMMARMQNRGSKIVVTLYMEAQTAEPTNSRNVIAEVVGAENPEEIVVLGGHVDSWDVGQGAVDDGGGLFSAWEATRIISYLVNIGAIPRPKRTIRTVLWVDEEISGMGAQTYYNDHISELKDHVLAMESDSGNFVPTGFGFSGSQDDYAVVQQIGEVLLSSIGAGNITFGNGADADNGPLCQAGVPCGSLKSQGSASQAGIQAYYFFYHHTNADSITAINRDGLRNSIAAYAVMSYVVADMDHRLNSTFRN